MRSVYDRYGDFAVSVLIGNAWASAMQARLGTTSDDAKALGLQADCFTGWWEAVRGTSFERMEAFRRGFFQDEQTCEQIAA